MSNDLESNQKPTPGDQDARLYVPIRDTENIKVGVKTSPSREYCFSKFPGEDYYHLLMHGEVYVTNGHDMHCLECALRHGFLTRDRLNWQHQQRDKTAP
ncbi:MAG: hypothetical protein ABIK07_23280 [Planctomycetota bacterium]|jgi:hypothetical protein|uniref:hypothetical protein n=1 Tax=uncultured Gimesia sp. TaxID=1678688 RepID=UPI00262C54FD|nr:hypothetical protein [uncultured Gimesia sp.]